MIVLLKLFAILVWGAGLVGLLYLTIVAPAAYATGPWSVIAIAIGGIVALMAWLVAGAFASVEYDLI